MKTWWPTEGLARAIGRWVGGGVDPVVGDRADREDEIAVAHSARCGVPGHRPSCRFACEAPHTTDPRRTLVVRWLAAGDVGDLDVFDDLFHPDAVVHAPLGLSTTAVEDEKSVWREAIVNMPGIRHEVQEVVVEGDVELARVVVSGTMASEFGACRAPVAPSGSTKR